MRACDIKVGALIQWTGKIEPGYGDIGLIVRIDDGIGYDPDIVIMWVKNFVQVPFRTDIVKDMCRLVGKGCKGS